MTFLVQRFLASNDEDDYRNEGASGFFRAKAHY
jgi:hypothetical protein